MKNEALKLADELDALHQYVPSEAPAMIRRLVAENEFLKDWRDAWSPHVNPLRKRKPLSNDKIREIGDECELKNNGILNWIEFARLIEESHGIK